MNLTFPLFDDAELAAVKECLDSCWVTMGPWTKRFEDLVAARHGAAHALASTSCTSALHLATMALGLGPGDEVIVPAFTWVTSAHAAEYVGAKPVFADVSLDTFNIDPDSMEAAVTPRTRAIVAVHLFGLAAPMDRVLALARRHNLRVIEDAACAIGTTTQGRPVGALGDVGCFSFHPRKVITTGEGGMVTTNDAAIALKVASLRNHGVAGQPGPTGGQAKPYQMGRFDQLGYNLRLSDIQAAVGVAQMAKLDRLLAERRRLADGYRQRLASVSGIACPSADPGHTYQSFVIRVVDGGTPRRNHAMDVMSARSIQTRPGTHAVHRLEYYTAKYGYQASQFPNACAAEDTTITLPIFPGMRDEDLDTVVAALRDGLGARA
jgi:perosamine synthetase